MTQKHLDKKLRSQFELAQFHYFRLLMARDHRTEDEVKKRQAVFDSDLINLRRLPALKESLQNSL